MGFLNPSSVSQCDRDTEFVPCSRLAGLELCAQEEGAPLSMSEGVRAQGGVLWGVVTIVVALSFGHQLHDAPPQTQTTLILLPLMTLPVEELRGWTYSS